MNIYQTYPIRYLNEHFEAHLTSNFEFPVFPKSGKVICVSDYSGDRRFDKYNSFSFLIINGDKIEKFRNALIALRASEEKWEVGSYIEYKKLKKDAIRRRILPDFLAVIEKLEGVLISILIDKASIKYFADTDVTISKELREAGLGEWNGDIARKMAMIITFQSFYLSKLVKHPVEYFWHSDRDPIFDGSDVRRNAPFNLLSRALKAFNIPIIGEGFKYRIDEEKELEGDFMAIPDLAAGGILEFVQSRINNSYEREFSSEIVNWYKNNANSTLTKIAIIIDENNNNVFLHSINFNEYYGT